MTKPKKFKNMSITYTSEGHPCGLCIRYPDFRRVNSFSTGIVGYGDPPVNNIITSFHLNARHNKAFDNESYQFEI